MTDSKFHFVIPSDLAGMRTVQGDIIASVRAHGFDEDSTHAVRLALEETLINAIKHGNKLNPKKRVTVEGSVSDQKVEITIQDEGNGFVREDVPDPLHEDNLEKPSGRGLLLIESYMTSVKYSDGGRRVTMIRKK
jgi:serine/threonine-protein kinase RsbW